MQYLRSCTDNLVASSSTREKIELLLFLLDVLLRLLKPGFYVASIDK